MFIHYKEKHVKVYCITTMKGTLILPNYGSVKEMTTKTPAFLTINLVKFTNLEIFDLEGNVFFLSFKKCWFTITMHANLSLVTFVNYT